LKHFGCDCLNRDFQDFRIAGIANQDLRILQEFKDKGGFMLSVPLSNLQMEILELYSTDLKEHDLYDLKRMLAKFYAERAIKEADRIWDEKGFTQQDMEDWLNE